MKKRTFLIAVALLGCVFVPTATHAQTTDAAYRALLLQLIEQLQQQIAVLQAELASRQQVEVEAPQQLSGLSATVDMVAAYELPDQSVVTSIPNAAHRAYFTQMFALFPSAYDSFIKRAIVFGGDEATFDAFVETIPPRHEYWSYAVHEDMLDDPTSEANAELIIHELAHLVAYEEIPGVAKPASAHCVDYFEIHGCPKANAYLAVFAKTFWSSADLDRAERYAHSDDPFGSGYDYYQIHKSTFVSDYAAQNPEEDFAESFLFYILNKPVSGAIASKKVDFFDQYTHLRSIKNEIEVSL